VEGEDSVTLTLILSHRRVEQLEGHRGCTIGRGGYHEVERNTVCVNSVEGCSLLAAVQGGESSYTSRHCARHRLEQKVSGSKRQSAQHINLECSSHAQAIIRDNGTEYTAITVRCHADTKFIPTLLNRLHEAQPN
jgi:hypothetical protein